MKKHWKTKFVSTLLLIAIFFVGCKKPDLNKMAGGTWNPNFAAPIGYADFDVRDILAFKNVHDIDTFDNLTGEMELIYRGEIASFTAQSLLQLNNYNQTVNLIPTNLGLVTTPSYNGSNSSSNTSPINFPMSGGSLLNTVNLESGNLDITVNTSLKHNINLTLTFPDILIGGAPAVKIIPLNYSGSIPQISNSTINLANSTCDFTANGTGTNTLRVIIDATVNGTGQSVVGNENFDISVNLNNLSFLNATGYFGQQTIANGSDSLLLKIFSNASSGIFSLKDPRIKFTVENSFGIPVQLNITNLKSINTVTNATVNLTNSNLSNITINTPTVMGNISTTNIPQLDSTNTTNMTTLVSQTPKYVNYTINAQTNPTGNVGLLNFIEKTSKLVVKAEIQLPLDGYAYDFKLNDTLPFKFNQNLDIIESVMLRLNATNGFPIDFKIWASFTDTNNIEQFPAILFNGTTGTDILVGAPVDNTGRVTQSVNKITDITLTHDQISKLKNVKKVIIHAEAATTNAPNTDVTIFDYYRLKLKLGIQTVLKQNF